MARLAGLDEGGLVEDWRKFGGLEQHRLQAQQLPYDVERTYKTGEICYTETNGEVSFWQWYSNVESLANKSPLDVNNRHEAWADNTKPFYWIPYTGDQVGMPFFWVDTTPPEWAVMEINVDLPIAVYWRLARRYPHLVTGSIINTGEIRGEFLRVLDQGRGVDIDRIIGSYQDATSIKTKVSNNGTLAYSNADDVISSGAMGSIGVASTNQNYTEFTLKPRNIARPMAITI